MDRFAEYYLKGQLTAQIAIAITSIVGVFFQPVMILALAGISLITMTFGFSKGLLLAFVSIIVHFLYSWTVAHSFFSGYFFLAAHLLPVLLLSIQLQLDGRIGRMLITNAVITFIGMALYIWFDSTPTKIIEDFLNQLLQQNSQLKIGQDEIVGISKTIFQVIVVGIFLTNGLSVLLARKWQNNYLARKSNQPNQPSEGINSTDTVNEIPQERTIKQLTLGRVASLVGAVLLGLSYLDFSLLELGRYLFLALLCMQGFAVLHCLFAFKKWSKGGLIALYLGGGMLMPYLFFFVIAIVGIIDNWLNFRIRMTNSSEIN